MTTFTTGRESNPPAKIAFDLLVNALEIIVFNKDGTNSSALTMDVVNMWFERGQKE